MPSNHETPNSNNNNVQTWTFEEKLNDDFDSFRGETNINSATGKERTYSEFDLYPRQKGESNEEYGARLKKMHEMTAEALANDQPKDTPAESVDSRMEAAAREEAKLNHMLELLEQQRAEGKAEGMTQEEIDNIRSRMEQRLDNLGQYRAGLIDDPDAVYHQDAETGELAQISPEEIKRLGGTAIQAAQSNPISEPAPLQPNQINPQTGAASQQPGPVQAEVISVDDVAQQNATDRAQQNIIDRADQAAKDRDAQASTDQTNGQARNQGPLLLSPELAEEWKKYRADIEGWKAKDRERDNPVFSPEEYKVIEQAAATMFYARQKNSAREAQEAADTARAGQNSADRARQNVADQARQNAADRAAQNVIDRDAFHAGDADRSRNKDKDKAPLTERLKERFKNLPGAQKVLSIAGAALGAAALALASFGVVSAIHNPSTPEDDLPNDPAMEQSGEFDSTSINDILIGEDQETARGIYDGYYDAGMFMSQNKGTPYDFANAAEVAQALNTNDEVEVLKQVAHCEVEALADQLAGYPDEVKAQFGVPQEFMGLGLADTEAKLQSLDAESYDKIQSINDSILDAAFTRDAVLNGTYANAGMELDGETATHDTVRAVACVTQEDGTKARELYWTADGNANSPEIGSVLTKITMSDDHQEILGGCTQFVIAYTVGDQAYVGLKVIQQNPDGSTTIIASDPGDPGQPTTPNEPGTPPDQPGTPEEEIEKKDGENLERIDEANEQNMAENNGSESVNNYQNPGARQDERTEAPADSTYGGTEADIAQNESAADSEAVTDVGHSENQGGAHDDEYRGREADEAGRADANARGDTEAAPTLDELEQMVQELRQSQNQS